MATTLHLADIPSGDIPRSHSSIRFRAFRPNRGADAEAFRVLNEARIRNCFGREHCDDEMLLNSESYITAKGGHIFFVEADGKAVGCCALIPMQPGVYEVGRMTVAEAWRGRGIGRRLLSFVIERARSFGAVSLYLETTGKLAGGVHLYESLGFRHLPAGSLSSTRSNVFMEMAL
jgi:N-acetylglutamate synthase-like GNAT family acetyltransferase